MMCFMNQFLSRTLIDSRERKQQANVSGATGAKQWLKSLLWLMTHTNINMYYLIGNIVFLIEYMDLGLKTNTEGGWICLPSKF